MNLIFNYLLLGLSFTFINTQNEFVAMSCGGNLLVIKASTTDLSKCYFAADTCDFYDTFDTPLYAKYWDQYKGDPSTADYVIWAGLPSVENGTFYAPLNQTTVKQSASTIVSTSRFLNYGTFQARFKSANHSGVVSAFSKFRLITVSMSNLQDEIDFEMVPKSPQTYNEVQCN